MQVGRDTQQSPFQHQGGLTLTAHLAPQDEPTRDPVSHHTMCRWDLCALSQITQSVWHSKELGYAALLGQLWRGEGSNCEDTHIRAKRRREGLARAAGTVEGTKEVLSLMFDDARAWEATPPASLCSFHTKGNWKSYQTNQIGPWQPFCMLWTISGGATSVQR